MDAGGNTVREERRAEDRVTTSAAKDRAIQERGPVMGRRTLLAGAGGTVVLCALGAVRFTGEETLVRPPGGQDYGLLLGRCVRCGRCVEACPERAIAMTNVEDGLLTQRMPQMEFKSGYCTWCKDDGGIPLCVQACGTAALELPAGATAENTILGLAEVDSETCLAYRDTGCRECFDACPYEAIEMNEHDHPVVVVDRCNGCGACEAACVSLQNASISSASNERAIVVRALDASGALVGGFESRRVRA